MPTLAEYLAQKQAAYTPTLLNPQQRQYGWEARQEQPVAQYSTYDPLQDIFAYQNQYAGLDANKYRSYKPNGSSLLSGTGQGFGTLFGDTIDSVERGRVLEQLGKSGANLSGLYMDNPLYNSSDEAASLNPTHVVNPDAVRALVDQGYNIGIRQNADGSRTTDIYQNGKLLSGDNWIGNNTVGGGWVGAHQDQIAAALPMLMAGPMAGAMGSSMGLTGTAAKMAGMAALGGTNAAVQSQGDWDAIGKGVMGGAIAGGVGGGLSNLNIPARMGVTNPLANAAINSGLGRIVTQAATTGDIDLGKALQAAGMAGLKSGYDNWSTISADSVPELDTTPRAPIESTGIERVPEIGTLDQSLRLSNIAPTSTDIPYTPTFDLSWVDLGNVANPYEPGYFDNQTMLNSEAPMADYGTDTGVTSDYGYDSGDTPTDLSDPSLSPDANHDGQYRYTDYVPTSSDLGAIFGGTGYDPNYTPGAGDPSILDKLIGAGKNQGSTALDKLGTSSGLLSLLGALYAYKSAQNNQPIRGYTGSINKQIPTRTVSQGKYGPIAQTKFAGGGLAQLQQNTMNSALNNTVGLHDGSFIIPADVTAALGNGSNRAGFDAIHKASGGLAQFIQGRGDGMSDSIPATIDGRQRAAVADGEVHLPPRAVQNMGGANRLHSMMDTIRQAKTGNTKQAPRMNPNRFLKV